MIYKVHVHLLEVCVKEKKWDRGKTPGNLCSAPILIVCQCEIKWCVKSRNLIQGIWNQYSVTKCNPVYIRRKPEIGTDYGTVLHAKFLPSIRTKNFGRVLIRKLYWEQFWYLMQGIKQRIGKDIQQTDCQQQQQQKSYEIIYNRTEKVRTKRKLHIAKLFNENVLQTKTFTFTHRMEHQHFFVVEYNIWTISAFFFLQFSFTKHRVHNLSILLKPKFLSRSSSFFISAGAEVVFVAYKITWWKSHFQRAKTGISWARQNTKR